MPTNAPDGRVNAYVVGVGKAVKKAKKAAAPKPAPEPEPVVEEAPPAPVEAAPKGDQA